ncbi:MAG: hypothetical protein NTY44_02500 [Deltaproteobacteria bacterium]|nr:hypothetical protein [Deltaproteobacteria bacterium]
MFERELVMEKGGKDTDKAAWHIYVGQIPHSEKGDFWVSFESKPDLEKTKANIYGRCLPCIQHLYDQLSRACAVLYGEILGDWREWRPVTVLKYPERVDALIERIRKTLFWSAM